MSYINCIYTDCDMTVDLSHSETSATLTSPLYPNQYPSYTQCQYTVSTVTSKTIQLTFNDLDIESYNGSDCVAAYSKTVQPYMSAYNLSTFTKVEISR